MAQTAPAGYQSNYSAILDLIRFGYGIWSLAQMAALLFHAERSTVHGREADQHSANQATDGIYSVRTLAWVRGPSGLSAATWYRANNDLTKTGILRRIRRTNRFGKDDATEFELDWTAISRRIVAWKEQKPSDVFGENESLSLRDSKGEQTEKGVSQPERLKRRTNGKGCLSQRETQSLSLRDSPQHIEPPTTTSWGESLTVRDTVKSKSLLTKVSTPREPENPSAAAVAYAIEEASGERPTDRLTNSILQTAERLRLPAPAIVRWIHDKCHEVRSRGYPLRAGLLDNAAKTELIGWCKSNRRFLERVQMDAEQAEYRKEQEKHQQMPANDKTVTADPEFSDLLRGLAAKKAAS
jgi:hypothetical protein